MDEVTETMSAVATVELEPKARRRYLPGGMIRAVFSGKLWKHVAFLISSLPIGLVWFVIVVPLLAFSGVLMVTLMGLRILGLTLAIGDAGARAERWRVRAFLGQTIQSETIAMPAGTHGARLRGRIADRAVWRDLAYLIVLFPLGIIEFVIAIVLIAITISLLMVPIGLTSRILAWMTRCHYAVANWLLGTDREAELQQRVEELTVSRSRVIDAVAEERRRIERDLHDGAQQRLVALAMELGMAKEKMTTDPVAAQALVTEAHDQAKRALSEMRELVRGIHPAVLTDRGLDAAVSALAGRSPVPVTVEVDLPRRLPDAVETNAYFVVAEALTNIAKHSRATRARVIVRREGSRVIVEIADNGAGGVDPAKGTGLKGLRDRMEALDGRLLVSSPPGGPTWIRAELPCGS